MTEEKKGFLAKRSAEGRHLVSRDWDIPADLIQCRVTVCPAYHNGFCSVPSLIKISPSGICEQGAKHMK